MLGDTTYGKGRINRWLREEYGLTRPFLHVARLSLPHPLRPAVAIDVRSELPEDLRAFLGRIPGGGGEAPADAADANT